MWWSGQCNICKRTRSGGGRSRQKSVPRSPDWARLTDRPMLHVASLCCCLLLLSSYTPPRKARQGISTFSHSRSLTVVSNPPPILPTPHQPPSQLGTTPVLLWHHEHAPWGRGEGGRISLPRFSLDLTSHTLTYTHLPGQHTTLSHSLPPSPPPTLAREESSRSTATG